MDTGTIIQIVSGAILGIMGYFLSRIVNKLDGVAVKVDGLSDRMGNVETWKTSKEKECEDHWTFSKSIDGQSDNNRERISRIEGRMNGH